MVDDLLRQIQGKYALNPIWEIEVRHLQGGLRVLRRFGWRALGSASLIALIVSALTSIQWYSLRMLHENIVLWSIVGAIGMMLVTDVAYAFTTVTQLGAEMRSGQWDLLRLTALKPQAILDAKYNGAQLRTWRILMVEISLRLFTVLLLALPTSIQAIAEVMVRFPEGFLVMCLLTFVLSGVAVFYVREPWWRMRAVVALSLAISASVRQESYAVLAALSALIAIHLAQAALLVGIPLFLLLAGRETFGLAGLCIVPYMIVLVCGLTFWFYKFLRVNALRFALRHAFRSE